MVLISMMGFLVTYSEEEDPHKTEPEIIEKQE